MFTFLQRIDLFGVEEKLQVHPQDPVQKSWFGGLMTIILYGISLGYFIVELIDWTHNNKLPKITTFRSQIDQQEVVKLTGRFLEIQSDQFNSRLDPFDPENLILIPLAFKIIKSHSEPMPIDIKNESFKLNGVQQNIFYLEEQEIIGSSNQASETISYKIQLVTCQSYQISIQSTLKCANQTFTDEYMSQAENYVKITFYITDFNTKSMELYKIPKTITKVISASTQQTYQFNLDVNNLKTDDGFLFNNYNKYSYIIDYSVETTGLTLDKANDGFQVPLTMVFLLNQIKTSTLIEYSKISELLASTGAIISGILQISFIVSKYNEKLCSEQTINGVIKMYFPDFLNLNIKRNIFGQITRVNIKNKYYDPQKIERLIDKITQIAQSKVSFINLQYEISRLQILLTKHLGITSIQNSKDNENQIEKMLDTLDCKQKLTKQPIESSTNLQEDQNEISSSQEFTDPNENDQLEQTIGLLFLKTPFTEFVKRQQFKPKHVNLSIIVPKDRLQPEDVSNINSSH